ncbi:MAG: ribonuclease HII [Candidatus Spechtbacterales bacterium]
MDFSYEQRIRHELGHTVIAGVDEVGRGPLAGPVTAAAFVFLEEVPLGDLKGIKESKLLSRAKRERFFSYFTAWKEQGLVDFATASVFPNTIDKKDIQEATVLAMRRAVQKLSKKPEYAIVDQIAYREPVLPIPHEKFPKADRDIISVAAASIVGKVKRDRTMARYHAQYPQYGFARHMGYGTLAHYDALAKHGPSPVHRRSFRLA